jgi:hypothetical protein
MSASHPNLSNPPRADTLWLQELQRVAGEIEEMMRSGQKIPDDKAIEFCALSSGSQARLKNLLGLPEDINNDLVIDQSGAQRLVDDYIGNITDEPEEHDISGDEMNILKTSRDKWVKARFVETVHSSVVSYIAVEVLVPPGLDECDSLWEGVTEEIDDNLEFQQEPTVDNDDSNEREYTLTMV